MVNQFIKKKLSNKKDAIMMQISKVSFFNTEKISKENKLIQLIKMQNKIEKISK
jgi:uncharacterized protein with PhoU and TrkA domain